VARFLALTVAVAVTVAISASTTLAPAFCDVRQQRQLSRALDGARDLALMTTARTRDPPRTDLAALGDKAT
jgi:hypothetical protein